MNSPLHLSTSAGLRHLSAYLHSKRFEVSLNDTKIIPQKSIESIQRGSHLTCHVTTIVVIHNGFVNYIYTDVSRQNSKVMTVDAGEFIRRFLIHTLPPGFQRIRHFGYLANCHCAAKLALCRELLIVPIADLLPPPTDCRQLLEAIAETERNRCPRCGIGTMARAAILPRYPWPAVPPSDTS